VVNNNIKELKEIERFIEETFHSSPCFLVMEAEIDLRTEK
jgi:hypothetical protein